MRLPSLSVIVASLAVVWCIAGWQVLGVEILLYPLVWCLIAMGFYIHSRMFPIPSPQHGQQAEALPDTTNVDDTPQTTEATHQKLAPS